MTIQHRKLHFKKLGSFLRQFDSLGTGNKEELIQDESFFNEIMEQVDMAVHYNGWFTRENVLFAMKQWGQALTEDNLEYWLKPYNLNPAARKTVAIIMAGNIPLVGFHDFISVLLAGHNIVVKQSSSDQKLLPVIAKYLIALDAEYSERIEFTEGRLQNFDAVIATGSNNTARYFKYYFANKPSIIRKNRNSVAILTGDESKSQLKSLGEDIFRYFGLGCRNVSKLYVPKGYDFDAFYKAMDSRENLLQHAKYANNYDYNKAVYLMSDFPFLDNGFLLLRKEEKFGSPIATLFYEEYENEAALEEKLLSNQENLQCIVSGNSTAVGEVSFGQTQQPELWDYADNVDTLAFLEKI